MVRTAWWSGETIPPYTGIGLEPKTLFYFHELYYQQNK